MLYVDWQSYVNRNYKSAAGIKAAGKIYANSNAYQDGGAHNNGWSNAITFECIGNPSIVIGVVETIYVGK